MLTKGKEYWDIEVDFLSKKEIKRTKLMYLGKHPYDERHMFAIEGGGTCHAPDENEFISKLQEVA